MAVVPDEVISPHIFFEDDMRAYRLFVTGLNCDSFDYHFFSVFCLSGHEKIDVVVFNRELPGDSSRFGDLQWMFV